MSETNSVIIVTYNHDKYIEKCLNSVLINNPKEVIVVDNNSIDRTVDIVSSFSKVRLIKSGQNLGFGAANNLGASHASGTNLVFLNPDTTVDENWLKNLTEPINDDRTVCIPSILLYDSDSINTIGNIEHISGLCFVNGLGKKLNIDETDMPNGVSGACFAVSKQGFHDLGGFDQSFFCYMEDSELSWRMMINDYDIIFQPNAVVHHDYRVRLTPEKLQWIETGRYIIIRKFMPVAAIALTLPTFLISEMIIWGFCMVNGKPFIRSKLQAMFNGLMGAVDHKKCNYSILKNKLEWTIPETPLAGSYLRQRLIKAANILISLNKELVV